MKGIAGRYIPRIALIIFLIMVLFIIQESLFGDVGIHKHIYFEILFLLLLAAGAELIRAYLKQPSVMVLMVFGILLSPSFLEITFHMLSSTGLPIPSHPPEIIRMERVIDVFAQLGVVILLFKIGLENRVNQIFSSRNAIIAAAGVVFPFFAGYGFAMVTDGDFGYSVFLGAALTATSVGVTAALLEELGLLSSRFSKVIMGAAIVDDILGLLVLSLIINVADGGEIFLPIVSTILLAAIFIAGGIVAGWYVVRYLDRKSMSPRRFLAMMAFLLLYAYIAEFIGLSAIVGAFLAGVVLNNSKHLDEIQSRTNGIELLFMPIFFITLGLMVDVNALADFAVPIIAITIIAILTKIVGCGFAAKSMRMNWKESLCVGVGMVPRGEVALVVASIGLSSAVLTVSQYSIISAMALLTTFAVPPILSVLFSRTAASKA